MSTNIQWVKQSVALPRDLRTVLAHWRESCGGEMAWLDSAAPQGAGGRVGRSLVGGRPIAVLEQHESQPATLRVAGRVVDEDANGWRLWRRMLDRLPRWPVVPGALTPGWIGYVGFEQGRLLERLPANRRETLGMPLMRLTLHDRAILLDSEAGCASLLVARGVAEQFDRAVEPLEATIEAWNAAATAEPAMCTTPLTPELTFEMEPAAYHAAFERIIEYIEAGDCYQVNFAQRLRLDGMGDPLAHYTRLRAANAAPYAALLAWCDAAVVSVSPELMLEVRGRDVRTKPIKGTRPRIGDAAVDAAAVAALRASEKDAAELNMIIDLHRNDLGRVCEYGSVHVNERAAVETHPTVFHTVADVRGRMRADYDGLDALMAMFPAGSITGAPKIRAMQIIDELEPAARGVYTGAIGVLGLDGDLTMNVAIRTLQQRGTTATLHGGGGIVADSDPAAEYDETLAKLRGMLAGLGVSDAIPVR